MKKSRIYTKTGDKGKTSLIGGERMAKNEQRIKAIGSLDELNATIGLAQNFITETKIRSVLSSIQNEIFNIGAELANPKKIGKESGKIIILTEQKVLRLEQLIDRYDSKLKPLSNFILPGGSKAGACIHLARSATRRAERETVGLSKKEKVNTNVLIYLNRLSDLFFILARYVNKQSKKKEILWQKD